jgi:hypothetical protein
MESFFEIVDDSDKLRLPTGEILQDTAIIPDFCKKLGIDADQMWNDVLKLPDHPLDQNIIIDDGTSPFWTTGQHRSLNYRGNAIKRDKIWLQTDYDKGLKRYGYTGWQWSVTGATKRLDSIPIVHSAMNKVNETLALDQSLNAFILTRYKSGKDNIGFHSDKMKDFAKNSVFVVIKLGDARPFEFSWDEDAVVAAKQNVKFAEKEGKEELKEAKSALKETLKNRKYKEIFYSKTLKAGTAIIVGTDANGRVKHGVPAIDIETHLSGSIVGRCIDTIFDWDDVKKKVSEKLHTDIKKQLLKKRKREEVESK